MDNITDSMDMSLSKLQQMVKTGKPGVLQTDLGVTRVGRHLAAEQQQIVKITTVNNSECMSLRLLSELRHALMSLNENRIGTVLNLILPKRFFHVSTCRSVSYFITEAQMS